MRSPRARWGDSPRPRFDWIRAGGLGIILALGGCGAPPCPADMVHVPPGTYRLGGAPDRDGASHPLPPSSTNLPGFCIDRFEAPNRAGADSTVDVRWSDAAEACRLRGARLCGEEEWEAACRGPDDRLWSYGDQEEPGRCASAQEGLDPDAARPQTGVLEGCRNALGVHDLIGGASEWTSTRVPCPPSPQGTARPGEDCYVLRGGTLWTAAYGDSCLSRHWHGPAYAQSDDGFRCCSDSGGRR